MTTDFRLTLISRDPDLIRAADGAGIDRIGIDIERLGKRERQADDLPGPLHETRPQQAKLERQYRAGNRADSEEYRGALRPSLG